MWPGYAWGRPPWPGRSASMRSSHMQTSNWSISTENRVAPAVNQRQSLVPRQRRRPPRMQHDATRPYHVARSREHDEAPCALRSAACRSLCGTESRRELNPGTPTFVRRVRRTSPEDHAVDTDQDGHFAQLNAARRPLVCPPRHQLCAIDHRQAHAREQVLVTAYENDAYWSVILDSSTWHASQGGRDIWRL